MEKRVYKKLSFLLDPLLKRRIPILSTWVRNLVYDKDFFKEGTKCKDDSSDKVAAIINRHFRFNSVFDIGCGMGLYLRELKILGKEVSGCDSSSAGIKLSSEEIPIFKADATKPIKLSKRFDMIICFEVAEHIPGQYSSQLVRNCTSAGNTVLFTAAPPQQDGVGHINLQPYEFWIDLFADEGYAFNKSLSETIREEMKSEDVVVWIAANFMVFTNQKQSP